MTLQYPKPIVIEPSHSNEANACVIWLHGLGADGHDFESIVPQLNLPKNHSIRFVFPTAAIQTLTLNNDMEMRSWYDIASFDFRENIDLKGITLSVEYIKTLVDKQVSLGVLENKIILAGFSQGGLIALATGLTLDLNLAGVMALSTYFPKKEALPVATPIKNNIPIFMAHGTYDEVCPLVAAQASHLDIESMGYQVDWHEYAMAHQVCVEEILDIGSFITGKLFNPIPA